jgi:hypothetical protein
MDQDNKKDSGKSDPISDVKSLFGETIKKVIASGVTGAFMTEEALRNYLSDLKLPKEMLNLILQSAQKSKDEITQRVSKEMVAMIHKIDFAKEISKFTENHKFRISAEIEFVKKEKTTE